MGNKGFAITGIIYTLLILFLLILIVVIAGLSNTQKLLINSTENFETSFTGKEITSQEVEAINNTKIAKYTGKYVFKVTNNQKETIQDCVLYIKKGTKFNEEKILLTPQKCNVNVVEKKLIAIYSLEED